MSVGTEGRELRRRELRPWVGVGTASAGTLGTGGACGWTSILPDTTALQLLTMVVELDVAIPRAGLPRCGPCRVTILDGDAGVVKISACFMQVAVAGAAGHDSTNACSALHAGLLERVPGSGELRGRR